MQVHGPIAQVEFLRRMGIGVRAEQLMATASEAEAEQIRTAFSRLVDDEGMGTLFKVMTISRNDVGDPVAMVDVPVEEECAETQSEQR